MTTATRAFPTSSADSLLRRVRFALFGTVAALILLNVLAWNFGALTTSGLTEAVSRKFLLDAEGTIPAWFSSVMLLVAGGLMLWLSRARPITSDPRLARVNARRWTLMGVIFVLLSMDEAVSLHELLVWPIRERLGVGGLLFFAWVIPAIAGLAVLGLFYLTFLLRMPRRLRWGLVIAATLYVGGAVGFEMVSGAIADGLAFADERYFTNALYFTMTTIEESLEMLGLVVLIDTLLVELRRRGSRPRALTREADDTAPPEAEAEAGGADRNTPEWTRQAA